MIFSETAWTATTKIRAAINAHPFLTELTDGTLAAEKFRHYIVEDSLYLAEYARVLALAAARAPDSAARLEFSDGAKVAVEIEAALHQDFFKHFNIDAIVYQPSPVCLAYTSYLTMLAATRSYEVLVAAILPCFWIYWDVGNHIKPLSQPSNPYVSWIATYADPNFGAATERVKTIVDQAAANATAEAQEDMLASFRQATLYEWMFWDSAYHQQDWPQI